jgi:hypothetical protein
VWAFGLCFAVGAGTAMRGAWRGAPTGDAAARAWGSRSFGAVVAVFGFGLAGYVVDYPLCASRVTLFILPCLQLLTVEGALVAGDALGRTRAGRIARACLAVALILPIGVKVARTSAVLVQGPIFEDLRPLVATIEAAPARPILVSPCSIAQVKALPEWRERSDLILARQTGVAPRYDLAAMPSFWVIDLGISDACKRFTGTLSPEVRTMSPTRESTESARLWLMEGRAAGSERAR